MQLEATLTTLRQHYKDTYPDVRRVQAQLSTAQQLREKVLAEEEKESKEPVVASKRVDPMYERETRQLDAVIERLEAQLQAKDTEAKTYQDNIAGAEKGIKVVQSRIESTPISEQQYADIIRDREMAKLKYDDLNKKRSQSQIAEDLERRQQGETLEVLDPASLPPIADPAEAARYYRRRRRDGSCARLVSRWRARGQGYVAEESQRCPCVHSAHDSRQCTVARE